MEGNIYFEYNFSINRIKYYCFICFQHQKLYGSFKLYLILHHIITKKLFMYFYYNKIMIQKRVKQQKLLQQEEKTKKVMNSFLRTEPNQIQQKQFNKNNSFCPQISQSYKDLLFDHIVGIQNISIHHDKENIQSITQNKYNNARGKVQMNLNDSKLKLKENMFLSSIKVNLGSLSQFISEKDQKRIIFTSKKKRNQQSTEQSILKNKIYQKNQQEKILLSYKSSDYQKKLASRVVVQKLFEQIYDSTPEEFYNQNTKIQHKSQKRINLAALEGLLQCVENNQVCLMKKSKKVLVKPHETSQQMKNSKNRNKMVCISYDKQTKLNILTQLKNKYYDLRKVQIPKQNINFSLLIQAQRQLDQQMKSIQQNIKFSKRNSSLLVSARNSILGSNPLLLNNYSSVNISLNGNSNYMTPTSKRVLITEPINIQKRMEQVSQTFRRSKLKSIIYSDTIAKVTQQQVIFKKMQFKDLQMGLYMMHELKLQKIQIIRLQSIKIQMSLLFMFIDVLCRFAPQINPLKQFSISSIFIQNLGKFSQKITQLLKEINIKKLCLNYTDIGSKQFIRICIGISENLCIEEVEMRNNRIDYVGVKPLESILKICGNLKRFDLRGNEICNSMNLKNGDQRLIM